MPTMRPPTMAPGRLPKPPTTAAGIALRPMKPMFAGTKVRGASITPAMAAAGEAVEALHRDANVVGRELVLRRRLHRDAHLAVAEERVQQRAQHRGRGDDDELLDV